MANLRELALRTLLPAFAGPRPPAWALRMVEEGLGGFTFFGFNIVDAEQVAKLTATIRSARPDVVIATDEEGGDVTRLSYSSGSPFPGNAALGVIDDVELTRRVYRAIGTELASVGITLDMAPAVDVNSADDNPTIGTRSFGADASRVAAHAAAAITGLQSTGVAACAKHFPGHGATEEDSHHDLPVVTASLDLLNSRELPPFLAAIDAGVRAIMTAHIIVPALTGDVPATFSERVLRGLLRDELGFTGAVVSDALEMRGASGLIGIPEAAVRALIAGNDVLCLGGEYPRVPGADELVEATVAAIVGAVEEGRLSEERLAEAASRSAELARFGGVPGLGAVDLAELGIPAARRAVKVEGALPADLADCVIIQLEPAATIAVGEVPWGLAPHRPGVETVRMTDAGLVWTTPPTSHDDVAAALAVQAAGRSIVVVSRDTHRHAWARDFVEGLVRRHPGVVLVEMGWPAPWRPAGLAAYIATYGASRANAGAVAEVLLGA
jgi:beta-N-acetylhexosaminidase